MTARFHEVMALLGLALDAIGVVIVAAGAVFGMLRAALQRPQQAGDRYRRLREDLGRAILLGLEFLIAGDIIRSVVVDPTLLNVAILGLIVVVRTFLSMTLQLEVEGRWPWQRHGAADRQAQERPQ